MILFTLKYSRVGQIIIKDESRLVVPGGLGGGSERPRDCHVGLWVSWRVNKVVSVCFCLIRNTLKAPLNYAFLNGESMIFIEMTSLQPEK